MYFAKASQVVLINCPSQLKTIVNIFLLFNPFPPLLPTLFFETSCPIAMPFYGLSDTHTGAHNRFLSQAFTFWPQAIFLTLFPPFPSIPHRFQPNQTRPCSSNTPHPFTSPCLILCQLFLEFSPVLISRSLSGKILLNFQCRLNATSSMKPSPIPILFQAKCVSPSSRSSKQRSIVLEGTK